MQRLLNQNKIQSVMAQKGIGWRFNPPCWLSLWWNMGVDHPSHKKGMRYSILRQQTLNDESFHTILCEIEAILNSLPITKLSDDCKDLEALTTHHILLLKTKPLLPTGLFEESDLYIKRRWKSSISQTFSGKGGFGNICHCSSKGKNG